MVVWLGFSGRTAQRCALALSCAALAGGCGDDIFGSSDTTDTDTGDPEPTFDYSVCDAPLRDADCTGVDCGETQQARDYLQIMLEVVDEQHQSEHFVPTRAQYFNLTQELTIDYQLEVSWFRVATSITLMVPQSEDVLRQELAAHVQGWDLPSGVASPETISAEIEDCHEVLTYDPCRDNHVGFVARSSYDWEQPDCVYKSTYAVVSAATGQTLECVVEEEQPCD